MNYLHPDYHKEKEKTPEYKATRQRYREANRERNRQWQRGHYLKNKESIGKRHRAYQKINKESANRRSREWRQRNPEKAKAVQNAYWDRNKLKLREKWNRKGLKRRARKAGSKIELNRVNEFIHSVRSRDSIPCYYCQKPVSGKCAHIDHVVALSRSGNHSIDNLCASCPQCNLTKHDHLISEWKKEGQQILSL